VFVFSCIAAVAGANPTHNTYDVITRDIVVIGGGAAGTYAAIRLGDMKQNVMVIERRDRLGGNTETFADPVTGTNAEIGVEVWHITNIVKTFFSRFNVPLTVAIPSLAHAQYIDFTTGTPLNDYPGIPSNVTTAAIQAYAAQLAKYPFLDAGFDLPDPVPADLLMPFGDFVEKYNLSAAMPILMNYPHGLGSFTKYPTLYVMKLVSRSVIQALQTGFYTTARHDNSELYRNAQAALLATDSLLLNSHVISTDRDDDDGLVQLVVWTPSGHKVINAKKILFAIPPTPANLLNFDINAQERSLFEQFSTTGYYSGLLRNINIPANMAFTINRGVNTTYHIPTLPSIYLSAASTIPGLQHVFYGSDTILPDDQVREDIITTMQRLFPNATAPPEFAVLATHSPFMFTVSSSAIEAGFYRNLSKLQGYRHMYYSGAAFQTQDSSLIWQYTEALLPDVVA
jgi:hypothetical protein